MAKRSFEASKLAALLGAHIGAPVDEGSGIPDVTAVLQALDRHKMGSDHNIWPQVWEALHRFTKGFETNGIMPIEGDTADIGSATRLFRKGYFSELSTLIFKKENVLVMDGSLVLTKQSGKLVGDVSAGDSQIDFGQALTVGDWLILRAENKMEFMQVGSLVSGTTYNVSRNVDGSGANDWPVESVYFVRGHEGDGWIELSATDQVNRRVSFFNQGQTWSDIREVIRFGLLEQWQNAGLTGMGFALGDYAADRYIVYSTATGMWELAGGRMIAGRRNVIIDEDGISVTTLRDGLRFFQGVHTLGQVVSGSEMQNGVLRYFLEMMTGKEPTAFPVPDPTFSEGGGWFGDNFQFNIEDPYSPPSNARFGTLGQTVIQFMQSELFAAVPGKTVQFGFWRRFKNGSNYALLLNTYFSFEIRYFTATNQLIRTDVLYQTNLSKEVANANNPTWERVSGIGPKAPANAVKADLTFMLSNTSDVEWADIDDIELVGFNQVSTFRLYDDQASIDAVNGLVVNGPIMGSNVSAVPAANAIIQAGQDGKAAAGWIPDLSGSYLAKSAKAADSELLDGLDSTAFSLTKFFMGIGQMNPSASSMLGSIYGHPAILFADSASTYSGGQFLLPSGWAQSTIKITAYWSKNATQTGNVVWEAWMQNWGSGASLTTAAVRARGTHSVPTNNVIKSSVFQFTLPSTYIVGQPMQVGISRIGADAADTFANGAYLLGLIVEKA